MWKVAGIKIETAAGQKKIRADTQLCEKRKFFVIATFARTQLQKCYRAEFVTILSESKFHGGLPKKSSISDQPLSSYVLKNISPL